MHSFAALFSTYRDAWLAVVLVALGCSIVSVYVVVRRVAFLGLAVSQVAAAGVAVAFLAHAPPLLFGALFTGAGVLAFSFGREPVRVSREALVGAAFAVASALSVLCVFRSSQELDHVEHLVYGSLLYVGPEQVGWLLLGTAFVVTLHSAFLREFSLVSVDPDTARTLGVRTGFFEALLGATVGVMIALSIHAAGSLLTFALLVLPALTALLLRERLVGALVVAAIVGVGAAVAGLLVAILFDLPPGPTIIVAAAVFLLCAGLARIHPGLGLGALVCAVAATAWLESRQIEHDHAPAAAGRRSEERAGLRVEVELLLLTPSVAAGEAARVEYHGHVHGRPQGELWVLLELGAETAAARLPLDERHAVLEIATAGLTAGEHPIAATVWTGPPLDPDDRTRPLGRDECSVNDLRLEVRP